MSNPDVTVEMVPTRFTEHASQPGAVNRAAALVKGEDAVENLAETALGWLERDLAALTTEVSALVGSEPQLERLAEVHALARSLRDIGGHLGKSGLSVIADSFCELVSRMEAGERVHARALDAHMDAVRLVSRNDFDGLSAAEMRGLANSLRPLIDLFPNPDDALRARQAAKRAEWEAKQAAAQS